VLAVTLVVVIAVHIAPECRTGRIVLIADDRAIDRVVRLVVEYSPPEGGGRVRILLWEGPPPKTPSILNYSHRSEASFSLFLLDPVTGEWAWQFGGYIAMSGETHIVIIAPDKVDYISTFLGDFHRPQLSEATNLIYDAYHIASDMLSCVDAGSAIARMEERNRVSVTRTH
jgi:hypothetical protein